MHSTTLTLLSLIASAAAVPTVTPIPLALDPSKPTCSHWPNWIPTRDVDTTSNLMLTVSHSDDPAVNNLPAQPYNIVFPTKVLPLLTIDLRASRSFAKTPYRCANGHLITQSQSPQAQNLTICKDKNNGHILIDSPKNNYVPEIYRHEINGVQQDGVFLGALNRTTWGFRYHDVECGGDGSVRRDYYEVKLLGLPEAEDYPSTPGNEVLFEGFLEVVGW